MELVFARMAPLLCLLAGCASSAADWETLDGRHLSRDDVDKAIERLIRANDVKGLAVALIDRGEVVHARGYGKRMVEKDLPLTADTVIYGASLTKATFAFYVMTLVDDGIVDLDKPIADYLPKALPRYPEYADLAGDNRWRRLTLRLLLSHQPGFQNWRFLPAEGGYDPNGKLAFHFEPGTRYAYSGEGFLLAQRVLERGLGIDVGAGMQQRIFDAYGLSATALTWREDFSENYSHNYAIDGTNLRHEARDKVNVAGSMDTTLADWSTFLAAVARGDGLTAESRGVMLSPQVRIRSPAQFPTLNDWSTDAYDGIALSYGLGWGLFETPYGPAFFKEGHDDGTANYAICVDAVDANRSGKCMLLMSNSLRAEGVFNELVETLLGPVGLPWRWEGYIPYDLAD